jgi:Haem-degrading
MAQRRWGMVLIGLLIVGGTGAAWAAEEGAGDAPEMGLTQANAAALFAQCRAVAAATQSNLRNGPTKMWCAVVDREGRLLLIKATDTAGTPQNPNGSDAWRGSIEIAIAKAYTAMAFSSNQQAIDSRTLGLLSRLDVPQLGAANPGTNTGPAPLFGIGDTNLYRPLVGTHVDDAVGLRHRGLVTFAGGQPVYDCQGGGSWAGSG